MNIDLAVAHPGDIFSLAMVALRGNSVFHDPLSDDGRRDVSPLPSFRVLGYHPAQVGRSVPQSALKKREKTIPFNRAIHALNSLCFWRGKPFSSYKCG